MDINQQIVRFALIALGLILSGYIIYEFVKLYNNKQVKPSEAFEGKSEGSDTFQFTRPTMAFSADFPKEDPTPEENNLLPTTTKYSSEDSMGRDCPSLEYEYEETANSLKYGYTYSDPKQWSS